MDCESDRNRTRVDWHCWYFTWPPRDSNDRVFIHDYSGYRAAIIGWWIDLWVVGGHIESMEQYIYIYILGDGSRISLRRAM
nr:hypothetical protein Q903MT_gene6407 [Picea sitchensis]